MLHIESVGLYWIGIKSEVIFILTLSCSLFRVIIAK